MRIEFWLDFLCPITYQTHKNLTEAIKELGLQKYELYYRSLQIKENGFNEDLRTVFFEHHCNQPKDEMDEFLRVNCPIFKDLKFYDTNLAHQLAHLAKHKNLAHACNSKIFEAYFVKGLDISDPLVLKAIGQEVGLKDEEIDFTLNSRCYTNQIAINKENANSRGIVEVPHLRVNMKYNYNKFLTKDEIKDILKTIINKGRSKVEICGEYCDF